MEETIAIEDTRKGLVLRFLSGELMGYPSDPLESVTIDIDNGSYTLTVWRMSDNEVGIELRDAVSEDPLYERGWSNDWDEMEDEDE